MRGNDGKQGELFSYVSLESRVPPNHPLRSMREMVGEALQGMSADLDEMYSRMGRPSIPPERLLRALLIQVLYTLRSERLLMEQLDYNLLFRWLVGLGVDDEVWHPPPSPRIGTGSWSRRSPGSSLSRSRVRFAGSSSCRANLSRGTGRSSKPGRARRVSSERTSALGKIGRHF